MTKILMDQKDPDKKEKEKRFQFCNRDQRKKIEFLPYDEDPDEEMREN